MLDWIEDLIQAGDHASIIALLKMADVMYKGIFLEYTF